MIEKFEVKDFKCHEGLNSFHFPGITIVSGTNNSGKSSLLQAVYLLTQNGSSDFPALFLNGDMRLGTFSDVLNKDKGNKDTIEFAFYLDRKMLEFSNIAELNINFIYKNPSSLKNCRYYHRYPILYGIDAEYKKVDDKRLYMEIRLMEEEDEAIYKVSGGIESGFCKINGIIPSYIIYEDVKAKMRRICSSEFESICKYISLINKRNFKYLKAFRVDDFTRAEGTYFGDLGIRGEYTAEVISQMWDNYTDFKDINGKVLKFSEAFDMWIKKMLGEQYKIRSKRIDKNKYKVVVEEPEYGLEYELSQVGFGICQILPILAMILESKKNDVLIIENPEIHLHPKLQADIADLLIFALNNERRVIVETHSEHIINRLRLRIKENNNLIKKINIYFFEKHEDASAYQEIEVDKDGKIDYWPDNFLDQSYCDLLGLIK
jgi:predicted ATPase